MKTLLIALTCIAWTSTAFATEWRHGDFQGALEEAATCDGEILLDVYTTWCAPCRRLADEVFTTSLFAEAAEGMILVKVDAEATGGPEIARRYAVVGYPTVLVLDSHGNERDRIFGYHDAQSFSDTLRDIRFGVPTVSEFLRSFTPPTPDEVFQRSFDRGFDAASCGRYDVADHLLETLVELDPQNATGLASQALLVLGKYRHLRGANDPDTALSYFNRVIESYPESAEAERAIVQSGIAHARAGRERESLESFERFLSVAPADADRANAVAFSMALESVALPRARAIAEQALESSPDHGALWNTLAEVHFAAGEAASALEAIDRAIAADPDESYYVEQRARFEAAR